MLCRQAGTSHLQENRSPSRLSQDKQRTAQTRDVQVAHDLSRARTVDRQVKVETVRADVTARTAEGLTDRREIIISNGARREQTVSFSLTFQVVCVCTHTAPALFGEDF